MLFGSSLRKYCVVFHIGCFLERHFDCVTRFLCTLSYSCFGLPNGHWHEVVVQTITVSTEYSWKDFNSFSVFYDVRS